MKTLQLSVLILSGITIITVTNFNAYATCAFGPNGTQVCVGPPVLHMTVNSQSNRYATGDTITIFGHVDQVLLDQDHNVMQIEIYNPNDILYKSDQINVSQNGTYSYSFKINGILGISGWYSGKIIPTPTEWVGVGFNYESTPYGITIGNTTFPITYKINGGKINSIDVNPHENSMTIHTNQVRWMTLDLPRNLLDAKDDKNNDISFLVFTNYTATNFKEINSDKNTRTLTLEVPPITEKYNILERENAGIKIVGTILASQVNHDIIPYHVPSPNSQQKSGIPIKEIDCADGFQLVVKSDGNMPACVKPEHVTRLIQNGWTLSNPFNRIADTGILSAKTYNLKQVHYYDSSNLNPKVSLYDYSYDGIDKNGLVSINNQTFYQTTLNNDIYKLKGLSQQFHNVTFSFPEGTLTTPGGAFVNLDVKFKDGFEEIYGGTTSNPDGSGSVGGIPIPTQYGPHLAVTSITVFGNHTMPQAGLTIYKDKIKLLVSYDNRSSLQTIHKVSLGECNVSYESRTGFVPILYMPTGSTGKVCVDYFNGNEPTMVTPSVFDAQNLSQNTNDISVSPLQANIVHGNSTVVYTITSGNKAGFYGLTIFCYGTPIAVGYDNQSRIVTGDFPWLDHTYYCMLRSYDYHITGVGGGMGIKYVPP